MFILFTSQHFLPLYFVAQAKGGYPPRITISIRKCICAYASIADDGFWFTAESEWLSLVWATTHQFSPVETVITTKSTFVTPGINITDDSLYFILCFSLFLLSAFFCQTFLCFQLMLNLTTYVCVTQIFTLPEEIRKESSRMLKTLFVIYLLCHGCC